MLLANAHRWGVGSLGFLQRYAESLGSEEAKAEWLAQAETLPADFAARYFVGEQPRGPQALLEHVESYKDVSDAQRDGLRHDMVTPRSAQCTHIQA